MRLVEDHDRDPEWYERQYNLNLTVPDMPAIVDDWLARAAFTRASLPILADIPYGDHSREVLDLVRTPRPRGTVVFIHGGYWRARSKYETSWIADAFADTGVSVALLNYPLCPEVSLDQIAESVRRAFVKLYVDVLTDDERARIVIVGHAAGAYLGGILMGTDWRSYGLPAKPFQAAVSISGIFDLEPLVHTSINEALRLTVETARALSLYDKPLLVPVKVAVVVGGDETGEYLRQSRLIAQSWSARSPQLIEIPGQNHFTILDGLVQPASTLHFAVRDMLTA